MISVCLWLPFNNYLPFNPFPTFIVHSGLLFWGVCFPFFAGNFYSRFKPFAAHRFLFVGLADYLKVKTASMLACPLGFPFSLALLFFLVLFLVSFKKKEYSF